MLQDPTGSGCIIFLTRSDDSPPRRASLGYFFDRENRPNFDNAFAVVGIFLSPPLPSSLFLREVI